MKKVLLIIFLLILFSIAALVIWRYVNYRNDPDPDKTFLLPRIGMSIIEITSLSAEKSDMNISLLIKNTLPFTFRADSFQYWIYMNDAEIVESRYKKSIVLNANDSSWIKLPVSVFRHDVDSVIKANEKRGIDSIEYRIRTSFYTDIFFQKRFDFTIKRFLPLIYTPEVTLDRIEIDSLNFKRAAIIIHSDVNNKNVFDIKVKDLAYEFQIEDHEWVKGNVKGITMLKARSVNKMEIPITLSFKEVGKTLFKLLKKGKNVNYNLLMTMLIESEMNMVKNSKAIVKSSGSVKSLLKAAKKKS